MKRGVPLWSVNLLVLASSLFAQTPNPARSRSATYRLPFPPSSLQATPASVGQINLRWTNTLTNAVRLQVERREGVRQYVAIATLTPGSVSYEDIGLNSATTYCYFLRVEAPNGLFAYSNEACATTLTALPSPPSNLQAVAVSVGQINLTWTNPAIPVLRIQIERKTGMSGIYVVIMETLAAATNYQDVGLSPSTTYVYRVRLQTASTFSPYSNEAVATTGPALPSAPANLQAVAVSQVQVYLSWTNTASNARSVRVEIRVGLQGSFQELGSFAGITNAVRVIQLVAFTTYTFRVRVDGQSGFSAYSNEATARTLPKTTVFLVHPASENVRSLNGALRDPVFGIDQSRFEIDGTFDRWECAPVEGLRTCPTYCSNGFVAMRLAEHIRQRNPQGDIVIIGYSMGGLAARDMLLNNYFGVVTQRRVAALVTIGTPNGGYPYTLVDDVLGCFRVIQEMDGNWRSRQNEGLVVLSNYLLALNSRWGNNSFGGQPQRWLVVSGASCNNPIRTINTTTGCPDSNVFSDGVVCDASARFLINYPRNRPTDSWFSQSYSHGGGFWGEDTAQSLILCGQGSALPLNMAPAGGTLVQTLVRFLSGL